MIRARLLAHSTLLAVLFFSFFLNSAVAASAGSKCNLETVEAIRFRVRMLEVISAGRREEATPFQKVLAQANDPKESTETLRHLATKISSLRSESDTV